MNKRNEQLRIVIIILGSVVWLFNFIVLFGNLNNQKNSLIGSIHCGIVPALIFILITIFPFSYGFLLDPLDDSEGKSRKIILTLQVLLILVAFIMLIYIDSLLPYIENDDEYSKWIVRVGIALTLLASPILIAIVVFLTVYCYIRGRAFRNYIQRKRLNYMIKGT